MGGRERHLDALREGRKSASRWGCASGGHESRRGGAVLWCRAGPLVPCLPACAADAAADPRASPQANAMSGGRRACVCPAAQTAARSRRRRCSALPSSRVPAASRRPAPAGAVRPPVSFFGPRMAAVPRCPAALLPWRSCGACKATTACDPRAAAPCRATARATRNTFAQPGPLQWIRRRCAELGAGLVGRRVKVC